MGLEIIAYSEKQKMQFYELAERANSEAHSKIIVATLGILQKSENAKANTYVAFVSNEMVGFVMGMCVDDLILFPHTLYVNQDYRNQGIGATLLRTLETKSKWDVAFIYYEQHLDAYYKNLGYMQGLRDDDVMFAAMKASC